MGETTLSNKLSFFFLCLVGLLFMKIFCSESKRNTAENNILNKKTQLCGQNLYRFVANSHTLQYSSFCNYVHYIVNTVSLHTICC